MSNMDAGGAGRGPEPGTVRETTVHETVRETGPVSTTTAREPAARPGGSNLLLMLVVVAVLALVVWLVMNRGGDDANVDVNVPNVEAPDVNVEVRESGK
jgi:hypothetical protein